MWNTYTEQKLQTNGAGRKRWFEQAISPNQGVNPHDLCFGVCPLGKKMHCAVGYPLKEVGDGVFLSVSENHPPVVPGWAPAAWRCSWCSALADPSWFILERVGSSFPNCFAWFVLGRELVPNIGMDLWWHPWIFLLFRLGCFWVGWCEVWTEAGQCRGDCSAFSAPVRGIEHEPYQSSNFIVVPPG